MQDKLYLISPIPPSVNHYLGWRCVYNKATKRHMAMSYETPDAKKYKKEFIKYVLDETKKQGWQFENNKFQHFYVDAIFYFDRIDKDTSNYDKCLLDAITETQSVWVDDNTVCFRPNRIYYDSNNPRIELEIYKVNYIGIFDDLAQLDEFKSNCFQCSKYKDGKCSVYKKAIEGRIQEEIDNMKCLKFK